MMRLNAVSAVAAAATLMGVSAACNGQSDSSNQNTSATSSTPPPTAASTNPMGLDFVIDTVPQCTVVVDGAGHGADTLKVGYELRSLGPGQVDKPVAVRIGLDGGASATTRPTSSRFAMC